MTIYLEIAAQYAIADDAFAQAERIAFNNDDDAAFDAANTARKHNDQCYFLYLFTRLEAEINASVDRLIQVRLIGVWADTRIWSAWSKGTIKDIHFLGKASVLTDKSRSDYAQIAKYYEARNHLGHGGDLVAQYVIPSVAQKMHEITSRFILT